MENRKILNREALSHLEQIKPGLAADMLALFLEQAEGRYQLCREGFAKPDWRAVENATHSLKSGAGQLGAEQFLDLCNRLEEAAESGDADMADMAGEFETLYAKTIAALQQEKAAWIPKGK